MSRPQVGIDRLPQRRLSNEPREAMNCKSCRKRKIKCNRLRPTCEACQVFACPCIYDAVPKKRGPKTDAIEALLKRVDSLEKRLHEENKDKPPAEKKEEPPIEDFNAPQPPSKPAAPPPPIAQKPAIGINPNANTSSSSISPTDVRYVQFRWPEPEDYAARARAELDTDEPSIEALQTLLLLAMANYQSGRGKKTFMLLTTAISMAFALELHRELPLMMNIPPSEREGQHQSWQIEATNLCFLHANAIAELVEIGRASSIIDWPAFVGYCVGTAVKSMAGNAMRFSPTLDLEDFFDRYPGHAIDGAHVTFQDLSHDSIRESVSLYAASPQNPYYGANSFPVPAQPPLLPSQPNQSPTSPLERRRKRRCTVASSTSGHSNANPNIKSENGNNGVSASVSNEQNGIANGTGNQSGSNNQITSPESQHHQPPSQQQHSQNRMHELNVAESNSHISNFQQQQVITPFSPNFTFSAAFTPDPSGNSAAHHNGGNNDGQYDPMFGIPTPYEQQRTPGATSAAGSNHTEASSEKDPFLTLLEQLAENEQSRGGPSELDFFLSGTQ
ncbi:putative fungal transcriptional regulatory-like protein [Neofusicoccum parvum UCRNP2]|uniref:Putative fungal transcriptional regulatory-like protein n=1 Tax=Botryosphaeria parva (strain UCR-NP2) TaxID=1287680 RepID=R1EJ18_BOTPV|nr:putative fungal transcriptional regulatory-like protein [Neofusicoccum parvum UCRNP2]